MTPAPKPRPETTDERRARQIAYFVELAELNMRAARSAARRIEAAEAATPDDPAAAASPTLDLARATRAVSLAVNAENRILDGEPPLRAPAGDTRRPKLRDTLQQAAAKEPDPLHRAHLRRQVDEQVEFALALDPDAETPIHEHLFAIADLLQVDLDVTRLPDEMIGMPPRQPHPDYCRPPGHDDDDETIRDEFGNYIPILRLPPRPG